MLSGTMGRIHPSQSQISRKSQADQKLERDQLRKDEWENNDRDKDQWQE
jgi:hypothetical protein